MADKPTTTKMPQQSHQRCHLLKLSPELRLEICRLAFQLDTGLIGSKPDSYTSSTLPYRGTLALLRTCRTLRTECLDAVERLAVATKDSLRGELDLFVTSVDVARVAWHGDFPRWPFSDLTTFPETEERMRLGVEKIEEVCRVLASAKAADMKMMKGM